MRTLPSAGETFLITGAMAAGKSTIADLLARRFSHGVHVRGDQFRRAIVTGQAEMTANLSDEALQQLQLRYHLAGQVADAYTAAGFTVAVQDVAVGPLLADFVEAVTNRPRYVVVLAPDARTLGEREEARDKTGYAGALTPAVMDHSLRTETPRLGLWLDTSALTPEETVDTILERRAEAAVAG